ncbi:peptidoglycan-binding domain-containing protein [Actinomadura hibisca]|uniref:peptidoglycan-binding domain-containing protein n=1 Tax=Actinomadura hibisca TaxID=68565 RepID=UPI00082CDB36|nr:peptidoglycan-binding domain-containing protein [Actinomadura hibisca]
MPWDEEAHPRDEAGEFSVASSSSSPSGQAMAYDPKRKTGPGYGQKGGDPKVKEVQQLLAKLGLTDASGKPLALDGKLGPKTTEAIKAAQRKYGMKPDGKVTPSVLAKLKKAKPRTKTSRLRKPRTGGPRKKK